MPIALVPHVADRPDRIHVWVGVAGAKAAPQLAWKCDGAAIVPVARRALVPVLEGPLAARADTTVHAGVFEVPAADPDRAYRVEVSADGETLARMLRPVPAAISADRQAPLTILLTSCFHRLEDKTGHAGHALAACRIRPALSIFAGDQVYLDLPTLEDFKDDAAWLANRFQNNYLGNWFGTGQPGDPDAVPSGFPQVLSLAPGLFMPDDHEYWNNYPFRAVPVQNTWSAPGRDRWKTAAEANYVGFQQSGVTRFGQARTLVIEPLSILMLDTRSRRSPDSRNNPGDLLGAEGVQALAGWVDDLLASAGTSAPRFGMLVTGQSLFRAAAGSVRGAVADYEFADYPADCRFMRTQLERLSQAGLPTLLLTGDVHWGRALRADDPSRPGATLFEVISSPTSLVSSVGMDQAKSFWGVVRSTFGARDPWPRHSDPENPPPRFGNGNRYATTLLPRSAGGPATMRGNQAFMLRFVRAGGGLDADVVCLPLSGDDAFDVAQQWTTPIRLRPPRQL